MADVIQIRRDTAANWTSANPTLASGEIGLETDTDLFKVGDGATAWASNTYGGIQGDQGIQGIQGDQGIQGIQGDAGEVTLAGSETLSNKTLVAPILEGTPVEEIFAITGTTPAIDPANGSIQTWTLSASSTPTDSFAAGEPITMLIDDGTDYAIDWSTISVVWKTGGGIAPTLNTTGETIIAFWKVGTTVYGARVGDA
jgi:hypothetical protein